jgi:hypothetical protein
MSGLLRQSTSQHSQSSSFWDIMPCSPMSSACYLLHAGFLFSLFFETEDVGKHFLPKRRLTFNGRHGVAFQINYRYANLKSYHQNLF